MADVKSFTEETLLSLGATPANKGFRYVVKAMELFEKDKEMQYHRTTLYTFIANEYDETWTRVERCIRHIVNGVMKAIGSSECKEFFSLRDGEKLTNGRFLNTLFLKYEQTKRGACEQ